MNNHTDSNFQYTPWEDKKRAGVRAKAARSVDVNALRPAAHWVAKINPFELFTVAELADIFHVSKNVIFCCKRNGAHFVFDMSRPEWITEFLRKPECNGIQVKTTLPKIEMLSDPKAQSGQ